MENKSPIPYNHRQFISLFRNNRKKKKTKIVRERTRKAAKSKTWEWRVNNSREKNNKTRTLWAGIWPKWWMYNVTIYNFIMVIGLQPIESDNYVFCHLAWSFFMCVCVRAFSVWMRLISFDLRVLWPVTLGTSQLSNHTYKRHGHKHGYRHTYSSSKN